MYSPLVLLEFINDTVVKELRYALFFHPKKSFNYVYIGILFVVVDFDNTDTSWRKYDASKSNWSFSDIPWGLPSLDEILLFQQCEFHFVVTARELFRQFRSSERLFENVLNPLLQVGLFAPAERCSAAATLGMLYYFVLAHQV